MKNRVMSIALLKSIVFTAGALSGYSEDPNRKLTGKCDH